MSNAPVPFTALPIATALSGDELVPIVQGGTNKIANVGQLAFGSSSDTIILDDLTVTTLTASSIASIAILAANSATITAGQASSTWSAPLLRATTSGTFAAATVTGTFSAINSCLTQVTVASSATMAAAAISNLGVVNLTVSGSATIPTLGVTSSGTFAILSAAQLSAVNSSITNLTVSATATFAAGQVSSSWTASKLTATSSATLAAAAVSGTFSALDSSIGTLQVTSSATIAAGQVSSSWTVSKLTASSSATLNSLTVSSNVRLGDVTATAIIYPTNTTRPFMPAFMAISSANVTAITGDNTVYTILAGDKLYDRATNYSSITGTFTAPVAGIYNFAGAIGLTALTSNHTTAKVNVVAAGYTFTPQLITVASGAGLTGINLGFSQHVAMTVGQTALMQAVVLGASKGVAIAGSTTAPPTWFAGYLVG